MPRPIDALIRFLYDKYSTFCPKDESDTIIHSVLKTSGATLTAPTLRPSFPTSFNREFLNG
jgi:hypothetical protein